jgi:hypothetical protein
MRYLSENSLFILTVPALGVNQLTREATEYVERWLSYLRHCAPNVTVIPVLTKCDIVKGHETGQTIAGHVYPFDDVEQASVAVAALDGRI